MKLDKYYTKKETAKLCWDILSKYIDTSQAVIDPCAGSGDLLMSVTNPKFGFDILPTNSTIQQKDFKDYKIKGHCIFTNPPFTKALQFLNKSIKLSDITAIILPVSFCRYSTQRHILSSATLVQSILLPQNSFYKPDSGKDFKMRTVFQIWQNNSIHANKRILKKPDTTHKDFSMKIYNATESTKKFLDENWNLALYRTGMSKYQVFTKRQELSEKRQYILIYSEDKKVLQILKSINYQELANSYSIVKGFSKSDIIRQYNNLKGE